MNLFRRGRKGPQRAVVIGLDGMPHSLVERFVREGLMPNFQALIRRGSLLTMTSVVPTVSSTAWASIVSGCNPGKHGIYGFVDRIPHSYEMFIPHARHLGVNTWVDLCSGMGKRVFSMGVPTTFPPKAVNGILISGFLAPDLKKATYPLNIAAELEAMGYLIDIDAWQARENREAFLDELFTSLNRRAEAMFKYLAQGSWDLFVAHFIDTDRLHHFLWGNVENGHEAYTAWFNRFYVRVDEILGELIARLNEDDTALMVLSDHGFCTLKQEVHMNHWLRQSGFLQFASPRPRQLRDLAHETRCYSLLPGRFYVRVRGREWQGCVQPGSEYEQVRRDVAAGLLEIRDPDGGTRVVDRVLMREEVFHGSHLDSAPDFIAVPAPGYDLKGGFEKQVLMEPSPVNGTHTLDDAMWVIGRPGVMEANVSVMDVMPTLFGMLGWDGTGGGGWSVSGWVKALIGIVAGCLLEFVPAMGQVEKPVLDTSKEGMEAISKALGVACAYCHPAQKADGQPDYKAPSAQKATARYMQVNIVDVFVQKDGTPLTCATCHRGRATFLPRDTAQTLPSALVGMRRTEIVELMKSMQRGLGLQTCDKCHSRRRNGRLDPVTATANKVTARFMMDHYVGALLHRTNGKSASCTSCHQGKVRFLPRTP